MHPLLEQTRDLLATPLKGAPTDRLLLHPGGNEMIWSGWQVVDHLCVSWQSTTKGVEERLAKDRPLLTRPTLAQRWMQWGVCSLGYFPKGREAPDKVRPRSAPSEPVSGDTLIVQITDTLSAMDTALDRIEVRYKRAPVLTHHILGPLSAQQWRGFHRTHARHHVPQMERALLG